MDLRLPPALKIFNRQQRTIIFNGIKQEEAGNLQYFKLSGEKSIVQQLLDALYRLNIQSVLVEGGAKVLQSFIDEGLWDEARIITNEELIIQNGLAAPVLSNAGKTGEEKLSTDKIETFKFRKQAPSIALAPEGGPDSRLLSR
jgi:diaminohydroxyphosphoribosylaminopyrimidine deaminase/5-amino-6-(5-phosphoribosylamino)uracil reductase